MHRVPPVDQLSHPVSWTENTTFKICTSADIRALNDFLTSVKAGSWVLDRPERAEMIQHLFEKGGVLAGYRNGQIVAVFGYFLGAPSGDYVNKRVGIIYLVALAQSVCMTQVFREGLYFSVQTLQEFGIEQVRFHALKSDPDTNRLYGQFAQYIEEDQNKGGYACTSYSASVSKLLAALTGQERASAKYLTPDSYHRNRGGFRRAQSY